MGMRPTPPLSLKGSREVLEEMSKPPADTPERRRMFEIAARMHPHVEKIFCSSSQKTQAGEAPDEQATHASAVDRGIAGGD
jgi:hypothetical protein